MLTPELLNYILAVIALASIAFNVWAKVKNPQVSSEKKDALLAQKVEFESQGNKRQFSEMGERVDKAFVIAKNDISHVDAKVDVLIATVNANHLDMAVRVGRLETLIAGLKK